MAFIRTVRTGSGATAVQLVEKRRGRRWILEHLGSAHTESELAVLMDAAAQRLEAMASSRVPAWVDLLLRCLGPGLADPRPRRPYVGALAHDCLVPRGLKPQE